MVKKVLIIGGAGMVGRNLAEALVASGRLGDRPVTEVTLFDVVPAMTQGTDSLRVRVETGDIADRATVDALIAPRPDVIFHLAAIVSGEAEADFDKGYRINLDGTRNLFEAIRAIPGYHPRVVYTSSIAVFGAPFPEAIGDDFITAPMTSYGAQKMIGELLLNDYSRRGIFDGVGIRLPTIVVRPGKPNKAASGFFSGIIREPLAGLEAVLPVDDDVRHWVASPASATGFLIHAATMVSARVSRNGVLRATAGFHAAPSHQAAPPHGMPPAELKSPPTATPPFGSKARALTKLSTPRPNGDQADPFQRAR
mgnify:CR=1 FL=1